MRIMCTVTVAMATNSRQHITRCPSTNWQTAMPRRPHVTTSWAAADVGSDGVGIEFTVGWTFTCVLGFT